MLIKIVFYVSVVVICSKTYLNVIFLNFVQQLFYFSIINVLKLTYDWLMKDV